MSKKNKLSEDSKSIVLFAVDRAVHSTGYPVTGAVLKAINVTRGEVRQLVREGVLTAVDIAIKPNNGGRRSVHADSAMLIKGYYVTSGVYPAKLKQVQVTEEVEPEE